MSKPDDDRVKRRTSSGPPVEAHVPPSFLRLLDAWRNAQTDQPTRAEALKRLTKIGRDHHPRIGAAEPPEAPATPAADPKD